MPTTCKSAAVAALLFLCSAFNSQVRAAEPEVAVVVKIGGIPWFTAMEQGIKRAGKDEQVNAYMVGPTTSDPAQQVRAVEDLIAKKVSVIAVVPNDAKALEPVFDRAKDAGIPIITHESHKKYYEEAIFKNRHTINPDRLDRAPRPAIIETMKDKRVITDGSMTIEIHLLRDNAHAEGLLVAYFPKQKLLMQADCYIPRPGAPPLPAPSPYTVNMVDNVMRLKLDVGRVVHIHGGISPYTDVLAAARR